MLTSEFYRESREPNITYAYEIRPYWDASLDYGYNGVGYEEYNQLGKVIFSSAICVAFVLLAFYIKMRMGVNTIFGFEAMHVTNNCSVFICFSGYSSNRRTIANPRLE